MQPAQSQLVISGLMWVPACVPAGPPACVCSGEDWKTARNAWQPFFSKDSLGKQGPLMANSAARLCDVLASAAEEGRPIDIWRQLGRMTMDVVGTCAFGWVHAGQRTARHFSTPLPAVGAPSMFFSFGCVKTARTVKHLDWR